MFNFSDKEDYIINARTNNIVEAFHRNLNNRVSHYHPKTSYLVNELKIITINYYNKYIKLLSNTNPEKIEINYIANDIIKFIKKFVSSHKENLDIDTLNQYLKEDADAFCNLMTKILDAVSPFGYDVQDNLKLVFVKNGLIKGDNNEIINSLDGNSLSSDKEEELDILDDKNSKDFKSKKEEVLKGEELNLINGDDLLEEAINKRKYPKKKKTKVNFLADLEFKN